MTKDRNTPTLITKIHSNAQCRAKGSLLLRSIGRTRCLHDFASHRRKLHDDTTGPPSLPSSRTKCTPDFEAQSWKPGCMVVLSSEPPKPSISTWPPRDLLDIDACPASAKPLTPLSLLLDRHHVHPSMYSRSSVHHMDRP